MDALEDAVRITERPVAHQGDQLGGGGLEDEPADAFEEPGLRSAVACGGEELAGAAPPPRRVALERVETIPHGADGRVGSDKLRDVVRVTYVLPDAGEFERCWPVLRQHLGEVRPAAMMISAGLADPRMKIEIEVTALKGSA
mgnify:CR=1 FL=1